MAASITHRVTGMVLYGGSLLLAGWAYALAFSPSLFANVADFIQSPIGMIIVAGYVWSLTFHLLNGIRHLYWDSGRGLAVKTAEKTAWSVYIGSFLLALAIVYFGQRGWGT